MKRTIYYMILCLLMSLGEIMAPVSYTHLRAHET